MLSFFRKLDFHNIFMSHASNCVQLNAGQIFYPYAYNLHEASNASNSYDKHRGSVHSLSHTLQLLPSFSQPNFVTQFVSRVVPLAQNSYFCGFWERWLVVSLTPNICNVVWSYYNLVLELLVVKDDTLKFNLKWNC